LAVIFLRTGNLEAAQNSVPWIPKDQQEQIIRRLRAALPQDWSITGTALNRTPDDWYTLDNRGFEIDGKKGEHVFQIWFLPKDWLGIRQIRANRLRLVYWEGVLMGRDFKTITNTDQISVQQAIQQLDMNTPSLVNGGWHEAQTLFKDRMSEVDSRAQSLVRRFCSDQPCKDEAAYSLIVLGIPAVAVSQQSGPVQGSGGGPMGWFGREFGFDVSAFNPLNFVPYLNLFAGFKSPQSLARGGDSGGVLRNTGINFESDGLTGYPTLDATAHDSYGGAVGVEYLFNLDRQIVFEVATVQRRLSNNVFGAENSIGARYQHPFTKTWILRLDAMKGWLQGQRDIYGARVELRRKF